jgi:hypothetical protein
MRLSKLQKLDPPQLTDALLSLFRLWRLKKEEIVNTIAQFTNACSIHSGFYQ